VTSEVIETDYDWSKMQERLFVIPSFGFLRREVADLVAAWASTWCKHGTGSRGGGARAADAEAEAAARCIHDRIPLLPVAARAGMVLLASAGLASARQIQTAPARSRRR